MFSSLWPLTPQFVYCGEEGLAVSSDNAASLLLAAHALKVEGLEDVVRRHVGEAISAADAFDLLEAAAVVKAEDIADVGPDHLSDALV